ncbi:MAG: hypothetical protein ACI4I2_12320 [Oscillospiraceae bacterium]
MVLPVNNIGKATIKADDKAPTINTDDKTPTINEIRKAEQKSMIIEFIREYGSAKSKELCELLGVKSTRVKELIYELIDEDVIVANGGNRNRTYSLKK